MKNLLLLLLIPVASFGQRIKYKDLFPQFSSMSQEEIKYALKEYLAEDPDHPNANFRLAMIYEKHYKGADPLTEYAYAMANANEAKLRFVKAKQLIDEREVDRNNDYYLTIFKTFDAKGRPSVAYPLVANKITKGYDSAVQFLEKMPVIYKNFTRSVKHYDQAVKIFAQISNEYPSPEDLYLLHTPALEQRLTSLKSNYDSCLYFLDQYLAHTKEYPLQQHRQKYKIRPIETYRLDGLITRLNFLTDNIELWNYGAWVDQVRKTIGTQIADLRVKVNASNQRFDEALEKINSSPASQMPTMARLDKQLVFNLNNFDRQSMILALLEYKNFRQEWDIASRTQEPDTTFSDRNAEIYSNLIYHSRKADTLIKEFKTRITPQEVKKHSEFVSRFYGGQPGLEKFGLSEQERITTSFNNYSQLLRENLLKAQQPEVVLMNKEKSVKSGRWVVPLVVSTSDSLTRAEQGLLITKFNQKNADGSAYLAGVYKPDKKKNIFITYLVRVGADGRVAWQKDISMAVDSAAVNDAHTYPGPVVTTQEGCALLVRSVHATRGDGVNTFIYFNDRGEEKTRKRLKGTPFPRYLIYNESSNSFVMLMKGTDAAENFTEQQNITALSLNVLGDVLWQRDIALMGTVVNLISVSDGYLIAGNYLAMRDQNGKEIRTKTSAKECSPYLIKLSEKGEVLQIKPLAVPFSFCLKRAVKVNNNSINLIGYKEPIDTALLKPLIASEPVLHTMTNRQGDVVCTNY